jgi:hypothetical protein
VGFNNFHKSSPKIGKIERNNERAVKHVLEWEKKRNGNEWW